MITDTDAKTAPGNTREAFLDAAERLLIEVGYDKITTRRLGEAAGANHGLVHYYFGSMENLFLEVLERSTERLIRRQRALYAADSPFIDKWRTAMRYLDQDLAAGYPKMVAELEALGWNRPEMRARLARRNAAWRAVLTDAIGQAMTEYRIDAEQYPLEVLVSLAMTFQRGIFAERLVGVTTGHQALLAWIDRWLEGLEEGRQHASARTD